MESGSVTSKIALGVVRLFLPSPVAAQSSKSATATDWDRLVEAAKNEAKLTISIPAGAELRKQLKENCKKRFGIEGEVVTARGSAGVRRMADESKSGVRHFDLHIGGSSSTVSGMHDEGIIERIEPWRVSP